MATAYFNEYVEAVGSGGTLLLGSRAIFVGDHTSLLGVGESVGSNLPVAGADGTTARDRRLGELAIELRDVTIDGAFTEDNVAVAAGSQRSNMLTLMRKVATFWDDSCTGRQCTLRLTEGATTYTGTAQFEALGRWRPVDGSTVAIQTSLLLTVSDGVLA